MKPVDIVGQTFGSLTAVEVVYVPYRGKNQRRVKCVCVCGNTVTVSVGNLRVGNNTSCGCRATLNKKLSRGGYEGLTGNVWNRIRDCAIQRNKRKETQFTITPQYCWELFLKQRSKCALSGVDIYLPKSGKEYHSMLKTASLDRIDSDKGYIIGNVQWVHRDINKLKTDFQQDRFVELCKLVANHCK